MLGLLGTITTVEARDGAEAGTKALMVSFQAACLLPTRAKPPEWLKDQTLSVERTVRDSREVGERGDSLVLTPDEAARYLSPLSVTPPVTHGELPGTLVLRLRWGKEDKAPEYAVRANGRAVGGTFTKDGDTFMAQVATATFFDSPPILPVAFAVTCDKLTVTSIVLPEEGPCAQALILPTGETHRLQNLWYALNVTARIYGGAVESLVERGRGVDHFQQPEGAISTPLEEAGHSDRYSTGWGWSDKMRDVSMTVAGARRASGSTQMSMEGVVDDGAGLRTSVVYTLHDNLPLLEIARVFSVHPKKDDKPDDKPKTAADDVQGIGIGFRAAVLTESGERSGSRILCCDDERLAVVRLAQPNERRNYHGWPIADGWALLENPGRQESLLYLFDTERRPHLEMWRTARSVTLEPYWPKVPLRIGGTTGFVLALSAGELCGASREGAWVACRTRAAAGVRCAVVGRFGEEFAGDAQFTLGGERRTAPLERRFVAGVGTLVTATAEFPGGVLTNAFDATVAGIAARKQP